jgi:hypothetical protein
VAFDPNVWSGRAVQEALADGKFSDSRNAPACVARDDYSAIESISPCGISTKSADQNRLDQLARSNSADRQIITAAINLADHRFASFDRIVDPHGEIDLRGTYNEGLQRNASNLYRDRLSIFNGRSPLNPESAR